MKIALPNSLSTYFYIITVMIRSILRIARKAQEEMSLPAAAKAERRLDRRGLLPDDADPDEVIKATLAWLCRAQDYSSTQDGGVARHFSLVSGWGASYPETTGYIIPTMIDCYHRYNQPDYQIRAKRMLDWLVRIQMKNGAFQGGMVNQDPVAPVTFNTGQILLGLAAGVTEFGDEYRKPAQAAANWLVKTQEDDGSWIGYPSPFTSPGIKVYETHVAWSLLEAARIFPNARYEDAALRNIHWALTYQRPNGWFADCDLLDPTQPLTHTIGYVLRGILEAHKFTQESTFLEKSVITGDALLTILRDDGGIPGRLKEDWSAAVPWVCLTGNAQIASCWLMLYQATGDAKYKSAASRANTFVRRTVRLNAPFNQRGGVKGSFPVDGTYGQYEYLNWAAKFFIDSAIAELELKKGDG